VIVGSVAGIGGGGAIENSQKSLLQQQTPEK